MKPSSNLGYCIATPILYHKVKNHFAVVPYYIIEELYKMTKNYSSHIYYTTNRKREGLLPLSFP
jgi:hypothetical protein